MTSSGSFWIGLFFIFQIFFFFFVSCLFSFFLPSFCLPSYFPSFIPFSFSPSLHLYLILPDFFPLLFPFTLFPFFPFSLFPSFFIFLPLISSFFFLLFVFISILISFSFPSFLKTACLTNWRYEVEFVRLGLIKDTTELHHGKCSIGYFWRLTPTTDEGQDIWASAAVISPIIHLVCPPT